MAFLDLIIGPDGWGNLLMQGAAVTVAIAVTTVPFGFGGGLLLAVAKGSQSRIIRACCDSFTTFFRGIPDLLSLFIVYFGLQALLDKVSHLFGEGVHIEVSAFVAGVIALSVVAAAYSSEVWVSAISSVPKGQIEASLSLGLTKGQTFRKIVLPQLFRIALPGLGNIWTILLKDTSLISTLAVMDLMRAAFEAARFTREPLIFLPMAAGIYLIISLVSTLIQTGLERRSNRAYA